jgi:hypothetical protein
MRREHAGDRKFCRLQPGGHDQTHSEAQQEQHAGRWPSNFSASKAARAQEGGAARMNNLTAAERTAFAKKAAAKRWGKKIGEPAKSAEVRKKKAKNKRAPGHEAE